ncbi:hypothetical protein MKW92_051549 [Papaver armeniacum]|nr:hypothetical protein MKW92_051549 [Papaver armeniacum]
MVKLHPLQQKLPQTNTSHITWRVFFLNMVKGIDAAEVAGKQALSTSSKTATKMISDSNKENKDKPIHSYGMLSYRIYS